MNKVWLRDYIYSRELPDFVREQQSVLLKGAPLWGPVAQQRVCADNIAWTFT